jgi:hypothetical protein
LDREVEIARNADWSMVSRSQRGGFCISHARSGGGSSISASDYFDGVAWRTVSTSDLAP